MDDTIERIIKYNASLFMPEIEILSISTDKDPDRNTILITVNYKLKISGVSDQVTVQFT